MTKHSYIENVNGVKIEVTFDIRDTTLKGYFHHGDETLPREDFENVALTSIGRWYANKMSEHFYYHAPDSRDVKSA